jgi:hypothetical protein
MHYHPEISITDTSVFLMSIPLYLTIFAKIPSFILSSRIVSGHLMVLISTHQQQPLIDTLHGITKAASHRIVLLSAHSLFDFFIFLISLFY